MRPWRTAALTGGIAIVAMVGASAIVPTLTAAPRVDVLPREKQALEDFAKQHQAQGNPADKNADPGRPASVPDPPPVTGLLGAVGAPISGEEFTPTTGWAGWVDATTYEMVWGGWAGDPSSGAVLVAQWTGANGRITPDSDPQLRILPVPAGTGPLTITRVGGSDLVLSLPSGQEVHFNPAANAFR